MFTILGHDQYLHMYRFHQFINWDLVLVENYSGIRDYSIERRMEKCTQWQRRFKF